MNQVKPEPTYTQVTLEDENYVQNLNIQPDFLS